MATLLGNSLAAAASAEGRAEIVRPLLLVGAMCAMAAIAVAFPARDDRRVPGLRCSLIATDDVSRLSRDPVRLEPSTGNVCRYVARGEPSAFSGVTVVALRTPHPGSLLAGDGTPFIVFARDHRIASAVASAIVQAR